jgi:predicted nucleic acid-binding Zn ribbon protein
MTKKMGDILSELITRRGYGRVQTETSFADAWREAVGEPTCRFTRAGSMRRGSLDVIVANSVLVQELTFRKQAILARLAELLPQETIRNFRLRVGPIE